MFNKDYMRQFYNEKGEFKKINAILSEKNVNGKYKDESEEFKELKVGE